jgi:hypothetical protein
MLLFLPNLTNLFSLLFRFTVLSVTNVTRGTERERRNAYKILVGTWDWGGALEDLGLDGGYY